MPHLFTVTALMLFQQTAMMFAYFSPAVLGPAVAPALGYSAQWIGLYQAAMSASSAVASLACNGFSARFGPVRSTQIGFGAGIAGLLLAATGSAPLFVPSACLLGASLTIMAPAAVQIVSRAAPRNRLSLVFSIKQAGVPLGAALGGALIPLALLHAGWQAVALGLAVVLGLTIAVLQPLAAGFDAGAGAPLAFGMRAFLRPLAMVLRHPQLRPLCLMVFALGIAQSALTGFIILYLNLELGYSLVAAGLVWSAAQVATIFARLVMGWIADLVGKPMLVLCALALGAALLGVATAAMRPDWPAPLVGVVVAIFCVPAFAWTGIYLAVVARVAENGTEAVAAAGLQVVVQTGLIVGPLLMTGMAALTGRFAHGYLVVAAVTAAVALYILGNERGWMRPSRALPEHED